MTQRLTASEKILRTVSESDWQTIVIAIARINGWATYHPPENRPSRSGHVQSITAGWPDLVFARVGEVFVAELKRETGKTTPEQDIWLKLLRSAGIETHVWRPSDEKEVRARLAQKPVKR